jgi:hypothetical protein
MILNCGTQESGNNRTTFGAALLLLVGFHQRKSGALTTKNSFVSLNSTLINPNLMALSCVRNSA